MKTVLVDVHDTVLDLVGPWLARYNAAYGDVLTPEDIHSWTMPDWVATECGEKIYDFLRDPTIYDEMTPLPGAISGVRTLRELGYRVVFVTAATLGLPGTALALIRHGFLAGVPWHQPDLVSAADKALIKGDVLIDDRAETILAFPGQKILFDRPWNRHQEMTGIGQRARGWRDMDWAIEVAKFNVEMTEGVAA